MSLASLFRRRYSLPLQPLTGGAFSNGEDRHFQCDVTPTNGRYPRGWVLMDLPLGRHRADCSVELKLDVGEGFDNGLLIRVTPNRRGNIHDLILLPPNIARMRLFATRDLPLASLPLIEVGPFERVWHMARRVATFLWKCSPETLRYCGVSIPRLFFDLQGAYQVVIRFRANDLAPSYADWCRLFDQLADEDRSLIRDHANRLPSRPRFILMISGGENSAALRKTLQSVQKQLYQHCLVITLDANHSSSTSMDFVTTPQGLSLECRRLMPAKDTLATVFATLQPFDYLALLHAGDELAEHALYWMASLITSRPNAKFLYSDEDRLTDTGERIRPQFKPDWSPELLRSTNYIGRLFVAEVGTVLKAGGLAVADCVGDQHDLLLRLGDVLTADQIVHVPAVLCHRPSVPVQESPIRGVAAVEQHLLRNGIQGVVEERQPGLYRVRYQLPQSPPLISIIIPTRDDLELIRRCVESLFELSTYRPYEILVVDNQSTDGPTLAYFETLRSHPAIRILPFDYPFNYSAINNYAVNHAHGEVLCLLNNDTEVIAPDWMEEMLGHLVQKHVGVVGAKLYYPDGRVQHAGDAVGVGGVADHFHMYLERDAPGYCHRAILAQDLSAVTAACLMTWRKLYLDLGGLNEKHLPVSFNDVDYCLRVRETGFRVIWTPYAELYHHESASRGTDGSWKRKMLGKREAGYLRSRWRYVLPHDPFYNPNLNYERPDFRLGAVPRVKKPWLSC